MDDHDNTEKDLKERKVSREYTILFNKITKAINQLDYLKNELIDAQIEAELEFLEYNE